MSRLTEKIDSEEDLGLALPPLVEAAEKTPQGNTTPREVVEGLSDLIKESKDPDWVQAVYCASLDELHDPVQALEATREILKENPTNGEDGPPQVNPSPFEKGMDYEAKGVSGRRTDSAGRTRCYQDGTLITCPENTDKPKQDKPKKQESTGKPTPKTTVGPSKPEERDPEKVPPSLPEKIKPPKPLKANKAPKNEQGKPITGYTASGLTNTAFGDMVEGLSSQLGMRSILPEGRRSNKNVKEEGSSIDVEYDHSGVAFEIKAVCVEASEYKAKPKKEEMEDKRRFAKMHNLKPAMMIVVVDVTKGKALAYWREGIGAYALNPDNLEMWNFAGEIEFESPMKEEEQ